MSITRVKHMLTFEDTWNEARLLTSNAEIMLGLLRIYDVLPAMSASELIDYCSVSTVCECTLPPMRELFDLIDYAPAKLVFTERYILGKSIDDIIADNHLARSRVMNARVHGFKLIHDYMERTNEENRRDTDGH